MRKISVSLLAGLLATALTTLPASAAGEIRLGGLHVLPVITLTAGHDSNIYLEPVNEIDDNIFSAKGALDLVLPMEDFFLKAGGWYDAIRYADNDIQDREDWNVHASFGAEFPGGLDFKIGDRYSMLWLSPSDQFGRGEQYTLNEFFADAGFSIQDRARFVADFFNNLYEYDDSTDRDRQENIIAGTFYWRFQPKTSALFELSYGDFAYDTNVVQDNTAVQAQLGLAWNVTGKSTGEFKFGYEWKDYEDESQDDGDFFVFTLGLAHSFSRATSTHVSASRSSVETDFVDNPYYISSIFKADLKQQFSGKTYGKALLSYRSDDYPTTVAITVDEVALSDDRQDDTLGFGLALGWDATRWLNIEAAYTYEDRDSTLDLFDYNDIIYSLALKGEF